MEIRFDNNKKGITIESYNIEGAEFSVGLYTDDYNAVKKAVYGANRSIISLVYGNDEEMIFKNYKEIVGFTAVVDERQYDYITITFREYDKDKEELIKEKEELLKEVASLKSKMSKNK